MKFRPIGFLVGGLMMALSGAVFSQGPGETCASYSLNDSVDAVGDTNGVFMDVVQGDVFTFTMTPSSATTASWRIVSEGSGDPGSTLVGGGTVSGTLQYTVAASETGTGVGFYVDSIDGNATIQASCSPGSTPTPTPTPTPSAGTAIPTMSAYGLVLTMLGLLLVAGRRLRASAKRS